MLVSFSDGTSQQTLLFTDLTMLNTCHFVRNPGCHTIEEDLLQALHKARAIPDHGLREQQSVWFQRAARTDKGVSAVKQCVSLKMGAYWYSVLCLVLMSALWFELSLSNTFL